MASPDKITPLAPIEQLLNAQKDRLMLLEDALDRITNRLTPALPENLTDVGQPGSENPGSSAVAYALAKANDRILFVADRINELANNVEL